MLAEGRDEAYAAAAEQARPALMAFALLMIGDARHAAAAVDTVLAHRYEHRGPLERLQVEALRGLVALDPRTAARTGPAAASFELVDGSMSARLEAPIVSDLSRLRPDQRAVIVLERHLECPSVRIAEIVGRPVDEVLVLARQAQAALAVGRPDRRDDDALARELRAAVERNDQAGGSYPEGAADGPGGQVSEGAGDVARGRALVRRRRTRRLALVVAAALVMVLALTQLLPRLRPAGPEATAPEASTAGTPSASPSPGPPASTCDRTSPTCRGEILREWRSAMVEVAGEHLDPAGAYFTDFGYARGSHYETSAFWSGQQNALTLELYRRDGGATTVLLQIASSRSVAVRCGAATGNTCSSQRFLDGNRYTLSDSTDVAAGMEVQYSPLGDEVITVIARNSGAGRPFELNRGDLVTLVQDTRLRLPER